MVLTGQLSKQGKLLDSLASQVATERSGPPTVGQPLRKRTRQDKIVFRLDVTTIAELVKSYEGGATTTELATAYGISKYSVLKLLHDRNVTMRRHSLGDVNLAKATALYGQGMSCVKIAKHLGVKPGMVYYALTQAGVSMRDRHEAKRLRIDPTPSSSASEL